MEQNQPSEYISFPILWKKELGVSVDIYTKAETPIEFTFRIYGYPRLIWDAGMGVGCHFTAIDNLSLQIEQIYKVQNAFNPNPPKEWYQYPAPKNPGYANSYSSGWGKEADEYMKEKMYEDAMTELTTACQKKIGTHRKSFILISGNARYNKTRVSYTSPMGTANFVRMINHFCAKDPLKFGNCVMTPYVENAAHPDGSKEQACIWMPPHVQPLQLTEEEKKFELFPV